MQHPGTSLAVQWLGLHASNAETKGSIPGQETKIPHASQHGHIKKKKIQHPVYPKISPDWIAWNYRCDQRVAFLKSIELPKSCKTRKSFPEELHIGNTQEFYDFA